MTLAHRILVGASLIAARSDGQDITEAYCNVDSDWGNLPAEGPEADAKLVHMQVFMRHGARTQTQGACPWGNDKSDGSSTCALSSLYKAGAQDDDQGPQVVPGPPFRVTSGMATDDDLTQCLPGQLAKKGRSMTMNNGRQIFTSYQAKWPEVIPDTIDDKAQDFMDKHLQFRSTHVDRTMQSAMFFINGMYCPGNTCDQDWVDGLTIPWVDLMTKAPHEETLSPNSWICPASQGIEDKYLSTLKEADWQEMNELCKLSTADPKPTGKACWTWLYAHIDCFMERACPNTPFQPKNDTIPDVYLRGSSGDKPFRDIFMIVDKHQFKMHEQYPKQMLGPLMEEILNATEAASSSTDGSGFKQFMLYVGHDTGPMIQLYAAFGLSPNHPNGPYWPAFASYVALELWKTSSGHVVRWLSNGAVKGDVVKYEDFKAKAQGMIPSGDDCKYVAPSPPPNPSPNPSPSPGPAPSPGGGAQASGGAHFEWLFVGFVISTAIWTAAYFAIIKPKLDAAARWRDGVDATAQS